MLVPPETMWYNTLDLKELQCHNLERMKQLQ